MNVRRGLHRVGLFLSVPLFLAAIVTAGISAYKFAIPPSDGPWITARAKREVAGAKETFRNLTAEQAKTASIIWGFAPSDFVSMNDDELVQRSKAQILHADRQSQQNDAWESIAVATALTVSGALIYIFLRALAWVLDGFSSPRKDSQW